jgi:hypothetical protein
MVRVVLSCCGVAALLLLFALFVIRAHSYEHKYTILCEQLKTRERVYVSVFGELGEVIKIEQGGLTYLLFDPYKQGETYPENGGDLTINRETYSCNAFCESCRESIMVDGVL